MYFPEEEHGLKGSHVKGVTYLGDVLHMGGGMLLWYVQELITHEHVTGYMSHGWKEAGRAAQESCLVMA